MKKALLVRVQLWEAKTPAQFFDELNIERRNQKFNLMQNEIKQIKGDQEA